jgi:hypothetical protein
MNLVALLIAAQVVRYEGNTGVRIVVFGVATIGIVVAIAIAKARKVEGLVSEAPLGAGQMAPAPEPAPAARGGPPPYTPTPSDATGSPPPQG